MAEPWEKVKETIRRLWEILRALMTSSEFLMRPVDYEVVLCINVYLNSENNFQIDTSSNYKFFNAKTLSIILSSVSMLFPVSFAFLIINEIIFGFLMACLRLVMPNIT